MNWINFYGLAFMLVIMIPNIIFASINKDGFQNLWKNKFVEVLEQIGRMGCFGFMVFIIPRCGFGFSPDESFSLYLIVNVVLLVAYCLIWIICFKRNSIFRALALSIIPSVIFLASGILSRYIPLIVAAVIFAPCHIAISYKNVEKGSELLPLFHLSLIFLTCSTASCCTNSPAEKPYLKWHSLSSPWAIEDWV